MTTRCQCTKLDQHQCTRKGSRRSEHNPTYCWQHQKCRKTFASTIESKVMVPKSTQPTKKEKIFLQPFIQNSPQMIALDPNLGKQIIKTDAATTLEPVVQGLWETNLTMVKDQNGHPLYLTQFETHATQIKTELCEWNYEGVMATRAGWFGLFDVSAITKMVDFNIITQSTRPVNHYKYGVYVKIGFPGEFNIYVCYDVNHNIVAIKCAFIGET